MSWTPISNTPPQYEENGIAASGYYIKFYVAGTTTPTAMATDFTGGTLLDKCQLNSKGYPVNGSSAVFLPHIDKKYKIALFRNEADADSNNLANAAWEVDNLFPFFTDANTGTGFDQIPLNTDIVYPVDDVTALRALTGITIGQSFYLEGHTTIGSGSGILQATNAQTIEVDDNGITFIVDGIVIKRVGIQYATPEMYGAVGDGVADDSTQCQSAINSDLNEVRFDREYLITLQGVISRPSSFNVNYGLMLTTSKTITGSGSLITNQSTICALLCNGANDVSITGLEIDGQYAAPSNGQGVIFINCKNSILTDCLIKNIYAPWKFEETETGEICDVAIVSNNIFENIGQSGTKPGGVNNIEVSNNVYRKIFQTAISIEAENSTASGTSRAVVTGNILSEFDGTNTTDNLDGRIQGIVVSENFHDVVVSDNVVIGDLGGTHAGISTGILLTSSPAQDDTPVSKVIVNSNIVRDWDYNIYVVTDNAILSNLTITGNNVISPKFVSILLGRLDSGSTGSIDEILISGNSGDLSQSTGTPTGISADTAATILNNATISSNTMNNFTVGYDIGGEANVSVIDNTAAGCAASFDIDSVSVLKGNTAINTTNAAFVVRNVDNVIGNIVETCGANALTVFAGDGAKVNGNVISGVTGTGIRVNLATGAIITNNSITDTSSSTIRIEAVSTGCIVSNNVLDGAVSSGAALTVPVADSSGNLVY